MPNRLVRESITVSDTLAKLGAAEERFFLRLIVVADDFGRFDGRARILRARCFAAMLDYVTEEDVTAWLDRITSPEIDLVRRYTVEGRPYLFIVNWSKYQTTRAKESKYPDPTSAGAHLRLQADASRCSQMLADVSGSGSENRESMSAPASRGPARSRTLPAGETLTPARITMAQEAGLTDAEAQRQWRLFALHEFRDPHSAWDRTWQKWCLNSLDYQRGPGGPRSTQHASRAPVPDVEATREILRRL